MAYHIKTFHFAAERLFLYVHGSDCNYSTCELLLEGLFSVFYFAFLHPKLTDEKRGEEKILYAWDCWSMECFATGSV